MPIVEEQAFLLLSDSEWLTIGRRLKLSARQRQITQLIVERGLSNKGLAQHLGIEEDTVKTHIERLYRKLKIKSRVELMQRVWIEQRRMRADQR